jgi:predicted amidohydrolase
VYDKIYPFWGEMKSMGVTPAARVVVHAADFGRLGLATCFDVNFPLVWQRLADRGAELVLWPSAYSAGRALQAHALSHHYYVVSSTWTRDCHVYDITGELIRYDQAADLNVTAVTLDLDRCIFHDDFNGEKRAKLLAEQAEQVELEQYFARECWFVLRARRPGVSARALARRYGLEELRAYLRRSRRRIDTLRGRAIR